MHKQESPQPNNELLALKDTPTVEASMAILKDYIKRHQSMLVTNLLSEITSVKHRPVKQVMLILGKMVDKNLELRISDIALMPIEDIAMTRECGIQSLFWFHVLKLHDMKREFEAAEDKTRLNFLDDKSKMNELLAMIAEYESKNI